MADSTDERDPVEALAEEFLARRRRGESTSIDQYIGDYPQYADRIRSVFETLLLLEGLGGKSPLSAPSVNDANPVEPIADGRLGDFRLLREIGRGGMGVVFEAVQESLDRRVALKIMVSPPLHDTAYLQRFEREAKTAGKLHHTSIVPVYGVGAEGNIHYFAMQFIEGQGLDGVLKELRQRASSAETTVAFNRQPAKSARPPMTALTGPKTNDAKVNHATRSFDLSLAPPEKSEAYYRWAASLIADAADALAYAHRQGVVHRDIKPANLLLDRGGAIWITDFGLARVEEASDLTATGQIVGTVRYMAPERFSGVSDHMVDIYALGVTLYELLTLTPAFGESDKVLLIDRIRRVDPRPPRVVDPQIPRDLETITLKAMAKEPETRYAEAADFAADLRNHLNGLPILARRSGMFERSARWARRHPVEACLVFALFASLTTGLAISTRLYFRSEANREAAVANLDQARIASALAERRLMEVNAQRQVAQENLRRAMAAVDEYFVKTSESKLLQTPGLQPLRRELMQAALRYYDKFATQQANSPEFGYEVGMAHLRQGMIVAQIGKREEALALARKAVEIFQKLFAEQPTSRVEGALGRALTQLGMRQLEGKDIDAGVASIREANRIFERAQKAAPGNLDAIVQLAQSNDRLGAALYTANRQDEAVDCFQTGEALARRARLAAPTDFVARALEARCAGNLAQAQFFLGKKTAGLEGLARASELQVALAEDTPNDFSSQERAANALFRLGNAHATYSEHAKAAGLLKRSIEIYERVVAANPAVADYRAGLCDALAMYSSVLSQQGNHEAATAISQRGLVETRKLADADRNSVKQRHRLVDSLIKHAAVQQRSGKFSAALLTLDEAEREHRNLGLKSKRGDTTATLGELFHNRAEILASSKRFGEARESALLSIRHAEEALRVGASGPSSVRLFQTRLLLSRLERSLGNWEAALAAVRSAEAMRNVNPIANVMYARHYAATADAMEKAPKPPADTEIEKVRRQAIAYLKKARERGYKGDFASEEALASLRRRPDYLAIDGPKS